MGLSIAICFSKGNKNDSKETLRMIVEIHWEFVICEKNEQTIWCMVLSIAICFSKGNENDGRETLSFWHKLSSILWKKHVFLVHYWDNQSIPAFRKNKWKSFALMENPFPMLLLVHCMH